jgi:hypothetical protein
VNGWCVENGDDYQCECKPGWEGVHCDAGSADIVLLSKFDKVLKLN